jgi:hypothetical protein
MKRTLLLGSAWTASAAAAVGLGFLAISLVDASASTPAQDLESSVTALEAGDDSSSTASPSTGSPATGSPAPVAAGQQVTEGGTVYGSCEGAVPVLASAPAAGWRLDDSSDAGEAEFENGSSSIEVRVTCVDGVAQFSVEGPRADDSGGGSGSNSGRGSGNSGGPDDSVSSDHSGSSDDSGSSGSSGSSGDDDSTAPAPATTSSPSVDDSDGRDGGGHGSDDAVTSSPSASSSAEPGDDSDGRHGGGHGSDD